MRSGRRIATVAAWALITLFGFLAVAHVVLTVLFLTGARDEGVGYFLDFEVAAWLITLLDALVVVLVLFARRTRSSNPPAALGAMAVTTAIVVGRTLWMVVPPGLSVILLADAARAMKRGRQPA